MNTPKLETNRLILRKFNENDLNALYEILSDKEVNQFLPWFPLKNLDEAKIFYQERYVSIYQKEQEYAYAICLKENNLPIGYVNINLDESKKKVTINNKVFKNIVNQTAFASSNEETKPVLTGINFNIVGDVLECNSTDSYRLANKVVKLEKSSEENFNIVIPSHNILEFTRILDDDEEGNVEMHISNNKVLFIYKNLKFQSRLINGTYPNTSNLMPKEDFLIVYTKLNDLYNVIDRASILTSDKDKNIVTLETNGNVLTLKSSSQEIGRVEEKMNITKSNEEEIRISFSAKYMMEALKSFSTETVEIHFVGEIKPILVKSSEDETLTQLVLPIRTY